MKLLLDTHLLLWAAGEKKRLGFMAGQISVPDDFDTMGAAQIERLFAGS